MSAQIKFRLVVHSHPDCSFLYPAEIPLQVPIRFNSLQTDNRVCGFRTFCWYFLLIGCCLFLSPATIRAQVFPDVHFENMSTENGLSDNTITCLMEDSRGFLWIGTNNGLNRYDGTTFDVFTYQEDNENSISGNFISALIEDNSGVIWIGTRDGGITRYNPNAKPSQRFRRFMHVPGDSSSLYSNRIITIAELNDNYIVFSAEGISTGFINRKTFKISYHNIVEENSAVVDYRTAVPAPDGNAWMQHIKPIGSHIYVSKLAGGYVHCYDRKNPILTEYASNAAAGSIQHFAVDGDTLWIGGWKPGLFIQKNPLNKKDTSKVIIEKVVDIPAEVIHVLSWNENIILAATKGNGLYMVNKKTFDYIVLQHDRSDAFSLANNKVNCLLKDSRGILWVGTASGLCKYNDKQWQFKAQLISTDFTKEIGHFSIFEFNPHTFGILTNSGMYRYDAYTSSFYLHSFTFQQKPINPTSIVQVNKDLFYLTSESGIFQIDTHSLHIDFLEVLDVINPESKIPYNSDAIIRENYQVYQAILDTFSNHHLQVFSTIGSGIGMFDPDSKIFTVFFQYTQYQNTLSNNFCRCMYKDAEGNIWIGSSEGLNKWQKQWPIKNDFTVYKHSIGDSLSISHSNISGIWEGPDGIIWVTTANGLNAFDGKVFKHYTETVSGLTQMYGLYPDNNGNLWIPVKGGFEVFNMQQKKFRFAPIINAGWSLKNMAKLLKASDGNWMYGAGNYLITFNPDTYVFETSFPDLYIKDLSVGDKHLYEDLDLHHLVFDHDENFISISFSSLQLSQPKTVKYTYKLAGLTNKWTHLGNTNSINFTSLPPGSYTLYVRVTNPQGDWSEPIQMIQFQILKPYWSTWWFFAICFLIAGSIIYAIFRYREQQLKKLIAMRTKIANDLHDDVGSALSTISLFSEVAKKKSSNNVDLQSILDKITDISSEMQDNMTHIVWSLQPRNDNFDQMMLRIKSYALENLSVKNVRVRFEMDEKLSGLKVPANKRKELFLIYKEAINNVLKYAQADDVYIQFKKEGGLLIMEITDNGVGFDTETPNDGNGMFTMRERARALNGSLSITSKSGKGTTVQLSFVL